jgi:D-alanyl-D-alanine carboxypeptidase
MKLRPTARHVTLTGLAIAALALPIVGGCSSDDDSTTTLPPAPTEAGEPGPLPFGDEIQQVLDDGLEASNGAGVSVAVIVAGYDPWVGVAGYSAVEPSGFVPMRPDMLFQIGSIEKNFTAALMLQLVEEGRLGLDDPISRWVSGYDQIDPSITVRQILNHTSGIYDWEDNPGSFTGLYQSEGYAAIDWAHWWTLDDVMALVDEPDFPPGEGWHYSNTGYYLARLIIEAETGMPISQVLRTRLLDPLGLDHTWVECDQPPPEGVEFAHAWADVDGTGNLADISGQSPNLYCSILSSPTWTTAEDLARWSQALFDEGKVLSEQSLTEMLSFVPASDPTEPLAAEYGLGVGKFNFEVATGNSRLADLEHYGHSGNVIGYNALMIYLPQHHATVVALFNENFTIASTAGPLLEVIDRNL